MATDAAFGGTDTRSEPAAQIAVGLIAQPRPGEFNAPGSCLAIAGLADPLVMRNASALERTGAKPTQLASWRRLLTSRWNISPTSTTANSGPIALSLFRFWIFLALRCVDASAAERLDRVGESGRSTVSLRTARRPGKNRTTSGHSSAGALMSAPDRSPPSDRRRAARRLAPNASHMGRVIAAPKLSWV
jgi:hypothetical protein